MPVAKKTESIEIVELRLQTVEIEIVGASRLVTSRFHEKAIQQILDKQTGQAAQGREPKDPIQDFVNRLYVLPGTELTVHDEKFNVRDPQTFPSVWAEGRFGFRSVGFKAAAVRAANDLKLQMTVMNRAFHVLGEMVEIEPLPHGNIPAGPRMRMDMVRLESGVADIRFRPEFLAWKAWVPVRFNEAVISLQQLVNLFNTAGFGVGLGEWRPQKGGNWGSFSVANVRPLSQEPEASFSLVAGIDSYRDGMGEVNSDNMDSLLENRDDILRLLGQDAEAPVDPALVSYASKQEGASEPAKRGPGRAKKVMVS